MKSNKYFDVLCKFLVLKISLGGNPPPHKYATGCNHTNSTHTHEPFRRTKTVTKYHNTNNFSYNGCSKYHFSAPYEKRPYIRTDSRIRKLFVYEYSFKIPNRHFIRIMVGFRIRIAFVCSTKY